MSSLEDAKILPFEGCQQTFSGLRDAGKRLVHCHGTFDLLHPGHIKHLQEAKTHGDVLVVTLTSAPFVNKGPGRPVFSDEQRAYQLAHLSIVDYVVVIPHPYAVEAIDAVRPHVYCKGTEYATPKDDTDRRIDDDAAAVAKHGGVVQFVGAPLHSSTRLISAHLDALDPDVREYLDRFPLSDASQRLDDVLAKIRGLRVLVVGDLIVDRYSYCMVQGLTSKARVLSVRPVRDEDYLGGSLAIARAVASWGCETKLIALAGREPYLDAALRELEHEPLRLDLVRDPDYPTILKQRYVERPGKRKDLIKHFSVNRLRDQPSTGLRDKLLHRLKSALEDCDLVIACDYGHGMIDATVQALLEERSPYLALNCQTNSYNYGFNLITKYKRCDLVSLDEKELCLAYHQRGISEFELLGRLGTELGAKQGWLTLGSSGSVVWTESGETHACPAMTKQTVDTVGAGDAFFAAAALCGRVGADVELTSVLANVAGAIAANVVGNAEPVLQEVVVKNARYLLKGAGRS
ncbi:MAG: adenylyltransferase/cytidyltransferase family protein [Planctomycetes bacterium]|nr:adenylyltransferase/cytidyltransferase family protein [Planctomycetota bacterium]